MAITIIKQPPPIHSADVDNFFYLQSNFRFAPKFGLRANFVDGNELLTSLLLPTNPDNLNVVNVGGVLGDFIENDPKPFIIGASESSQWRDYRIELSESFEGIYILGTNSSGKVHFVDVVNNDQIQQIPLPTNIANIEFINGPVITPIDDIYIISYATGSNGFITSFELSAATQSTSGITVSFTGSTGVGSFGYIQLEEIIVYSIGATISTAQKGAIRAHIDYLPWNQDNDFDGYLIGTQSAEFLTRRKVWQLDRDEFMTLSFINSATVSQAHIEDNLGFTYSFNINIPVTKRRVDIGVGTANLNISPTASSYKITLRSGSDIISETQTIQIKNYLSQRSCGTDVDLISNIRLTWLNDLGGWDYWTFKWVEERGKRIDRRTYQKNLRYNATKKDRGFSSYRTEDYNEWTLVSDLVSEEIADWITSLYTSDDVYLIYDNLIWPVNITDDSYISAIGFETSVVRVGVRLSRINIK